MILGQVIGLLPMVICLVASTLVVFVWIRSYSKGYSYRWFGETWEGGSARYADRRIATGQGAVAIDVRGYGPTDQATAAAFDQFFASSPRLFRVGYRESSLPGYPLGNVRTDSLALSFGFQVLYDDEAELRPPNLQAIPGWRLGIGIPLWAMLCLTAGYPVGRYVLRAIRAQRQERLALGLCPACGLAINAQTSRCPGCNRRIAVGAVSG
jgi:hypothetical protein